LEKREIAKTQEKTNSELYKYASQEFKLKLLKYLNERYMTEEIPQEWRNVIVIPIFKKRRQNDPKNIEE
jgi:hypothetical protein